MRRMLDEAEFLSPYGMRALSKFHEDDPYVLEHAGERFRIGYEPGEGSTAAFGGNSNWRGPVWLPINILLIDSLCEFHRYYGDDFRVDCPTGSGVYRSLEQVAEMLSQRLTGLFLKGPDGRRALHGGDELSQSEPHFRDNSLFHEYFHGYTGCGLGVSHQIGWTGCVALLLSPEHSPWWQSSIGLPGARRHRGPVPRETEVDAL